MSFAFVFPGQGSQSVGMLAELAAAYPQVKHTFEEASEALHLDLWKLSQEGPEADLNQTDKTQPAMLAAGIAVARVWQAQGGPRAGLCAGHSLGEYTALVYAGALDFKAAVPLVAARGRFMQAAVPQGVGAMAAILGLDDEAVRGVCAAAAQDQVVAAVNYNAPGQVVVAGHAAAVERAVAGAKQAGAKRAVTLPVSVPSHCELMRPAAEQLRAYLQNLSLNLPEIPVVHNVDVAVQSDPDALRDALCAQLHQPVRWVESVQALAARGAATLVECGPGKVLTGLNKRIHKDLKALCVSDPKSLDEALAAVTA